MIRRVALIGLMLGMVAVSVWGLLPGCGRDRSAMLSSSIAARFGASSPPGSRLLADAPGSRPGADEELWVIERAPASHASDDVPTCGTLFCSIESQRMPVPLEHTDVSAEVTGFVSSVSVTQQFHNPYDEKIEAVYVFPLPQHAAVNEFVMTIGERRICGIVRDRDEAKRVYEAARSAGHVASLMSQERPNVFTQSVANIEPGNRIDIEIRYFGTVAYDDGWFELVFPMVVGPRFNPPALTGGGIGATPRGAAGSSGQAVEVQYLAPGERSGHDIALTAVIDAGVAINGLESVNHVVDVERTSASRAVVQIRENETIPNKDFVLRWRVADEGIRSSMITSVGDDGHGTFALMLLPPAALMEAARRPVELIFVIDCSGSMNGAPLQQCRRATRHALASLHPEDTFQIVRFGSEASSLGNRPLRATDRNVRRGIRYVDGLQSGGGTMMVRGMRAALKIPGDPQRLRFVCFMTDGYIGNEHEVLSTLSAELGHARVFSFGVGSSPNRFLMDRMAKLGNGAVAYLPLKIDGAEVMDRFFERACRPALTDIELDFGGLAVSDLTPTGVSGRLPDLFVGRPVLLTGRFDPSTGAAGSVVARGRAGDCLIEIGVPSASAAPTGALSAVWARQMIAGLADRAIVDPGETEVSIASIRELALDHGLLSAFTSFVAVDASRVTDGADGTTVAVPVPVPDGVRYETAVPTR